MKRVKIGLIGSGHLGKIHLKCIREVDELELIGFYDADPKVANKVATEFGIKAFEDLESLMSEVDAVDIVAPTTHHFAIAETAIRFGKHIFIEKPLTKTIDESIRLMELAEEKPLIIQVGHVERFNPAYAALKDVELKPMFIEGHRLSIFNPRGTDVSVVLDLMIHDIDILLKIVDSPVKEIKANGVSVVSNSPDIANARIEFENGCVANLTASRISMKQMRKMRLFQEDAYISMDFLEKKSEVVKLRSIEEGEDISDKMVIKTKDGEKEMQIATPEAPPVNAIQMELTNFARSVQLKEKPEVTLEDGYKAMDLAYRIIALIEAD